MQEAKAHFIRRNVLDAGQEKKLARHKKEIFPFLRWFFCTPCILYLLWLVKHFARRWPLSLEEAALIQALKAGGPEAYRTLVADYGDRVYNTVLSMMQQPHDAEDVVQEVFIAVYQAIDRFRGDAKLSTWIYRISVTKSLEALRRKGLKQARQNRSLGDADSVHTVFHHPGLALENRERGAILFRALARLPDKQKTAFVLHKTEGLSYAEIAEVMHISLPAVESLIYRARQALQKLLARYYDADRQ